MFQFSTYEATHGRRFPSLTVHMERRTDCAPACAPGAERVPPTKMQPSRVSRYPWAMTESASTLAHHHWVITLVCADQPGIVHAVSGAIVLARGNITDRPAATNSRPRSLPSSNATTLKP